MRKNRGRDRDSERACRLQIHDQLKVAEIKFLTWTDDNLLRQVVYEGLREDKPAREVRRDVPQPKPYNPSAPE